MKFDAWFFDLDDTLYEELAFVRSGFGAVADFVASRGAIEASEAREVMEKTLAEQGRGKVFDVLIEGAGLQGVVAPLTLVHIYRTHAPSIELQEDAVVVLSELRSRGALLGVITDGMGSVQRRKLEALDVDRYVDLSLATDELGSHCWKPSPEGFRVACERLEVAPQNCCYVGDNPRKDFEGANQLGITTIRLQADWCQFAANPDSVLKDAAPDQHIESLRQLLY